MRKIKPLVPPQTLVADAQRISLNGQRVCVLAFRINAHGEGSGTYVSFLLQVPPDACRQTLRDRSPLVG